MYNNNNIIIINIIIIIIVVVVFLTTDNYHNFINLDLLTQFALINSDSITNQIQTDICIKV